jgi:hypothetical protein
MASRKLPALLTTMSIRPNERRALSMRASAAVKLEISIDYRSTTDGFDFPDDRLGRALIGSRACQGRTQIIDHNRGARAREIKRDSSTHTATGAGDYGDFACEQVSGPVGIHRSISQLRQRRN